MSLFRAIAFAAASASLVQAVPATAHTRAVASTPAPSATVSDVRSVTVTFDEPITPALSGMEIVMTGMPGMAGHHPAMKVTGARIAPSADRTSLTATLSRPLVAGSYDVNWRAAGADGHRVTGTISFTVR